MKKAIRVVLLFIAITGSPLIHIQASRPEPKVYICVSKTAYKYHNNKNCWGLSHCTHNIIEVTLSDAEKKYHRSACKICYK